MPTFSETQPLDLHDTYRCNETNLVRMKARVSSVEQIDTAVRCLRVGKAAGIDRLTVEHVFFSHPIFITH